MTSVTQVVPVLHRALTDAAVPHAFGGAIALGYSIDHPRGTVDVDINIFVRSDDCAPVFGALPPGVRWSPEDVALATRDGQVRLWWDDTAIDLFFDYDEIHAEAAAHRRIVPFGDIEIPILGPDELAVFKAFFNRGKDWIDIESMTRAGSVIPSELAAKVAALLGDDDPRVAKAAALPTEPEEEIIMKHRLPPSPPAS